MRPLSEPEKVNLKELTRNSISVTLIEPTATGLSKSILDATGAVRTFLKSQSIHDYSSQQLGPLGKVLIDSLLLTSFKSMKSVASLYRPQTKKGDPRIWFRNLGKITGPNDLVAIAYLNSKLVVFNISTLKIKELADAKESNPIKEVLKSVQQSSNLIAEELLNMLRTIAAKGKIQAVLNADTAVGRTLETELGIAINSSKEPDYKGIELKAYREGKDIRKNLFAQVPNWTLSRFKSSEQILNEFGYQREEDFKLYCTVSAIGQNSQGLSFQIDSGLAQLQEVALKRANPEVAIWTLEKLHTRLLEKHNETFWIAAKSIKKEGKEYFEYKKVEHTKKPLVSQFDILLEQGVITMDHLIKRKPGGTAREKGPLFKIKQNSLDLLFPPSQSYNLMN